MLVLIHNTMVIGPLDSFKDGTVEDFGPMMVVSHKEFGALVEAVPKPSIHNCPR